MADPKSKATRNEEEGKDFFVDFLNKRKRNIDKKLKEIFNNEEHWHDAYFDTVACAILLEHLLKLDCFTGMSIEALSSIKTTDYYRKRKPST